MDAKMMLYIRDPLILDEGEGERVAVAYITREEALTLMKDLEREYGR